MSTFKIIITSLIASISLVSCGKSSDNKKNNSKAKNVTINSVWDNEFEYSGEKLNRQIDLTKIVLNTSSYFTVKIYKDSDFLICSGTATFAGTTSSGYITSVTLSLLDSSNSNTVNNDLLCKKMASDSNIANSGKGRAYEFSNSVLKLCDNGICSEYN